MISTSSEVVATSVMLDKAMQELDDDEIVLRVEKDPLIGKTLAGRYEILSVLGRGGMGSVYKARQTDIDRFVAVKTLHVSKVIDSQVIQKFRSEAQAVSRVRHPNTVMLYDFGVSEDGVPFLVMDILDGRSFRQVLKEEGALSLERTAFIFQQVCAALNHAHETGIVHKDLKPENIMLCNRPGQNDWVFVLDFGIAGLMEGQAQSVNEIVGSPPYMSPEQCSMQSVIDRRSDIYSLGICLFEALSGKFPFQARSAMEMMDCHVSGKPRLLKEMGTAFSTYESLSQVIARAMDKRPEKRQETALEFAAEMMEAARKDSKRGMQLKDRISLEHDAPRARDFVEMKHEELQDLAQELKVTSPRLAAIKVEKPKNVFEAITAFVHGDDYKNRPDSENGDQKYHFSNCPHCDAPTQAGISLCLSCGRSLASKGDFSKIRAAKGDFSLPKYQELGTSPQAPSARGFSQRTRIAMIKSGRAWTRSTGLLVLGLVLIVCVFIMAGGPALFAEFFKNFQGAS